MKKRGAGTLHHSGYHVAIVNGEWRADHVRIADKVLGRRLVRPECVHHVNGIKCDNHHENLVICPDAIYHQLLHVRTAALEGCGNANWRICVHCKQYDDTANLKAHATAKDGRIKQYVHSNCRIAFLRAYRGN